jgi:hypothetical protein
VTYPKGAYANIAAAQVTLPHSEFLDQSHIKTVCRRVQYAAGACPAASIYGHAKAITPLLDAPLTGPVYLRSSDHKLPDLVADLDGQIEGPWTPRPQRQEPRHLRHLRARPRCPGLQVRALDARRQEGAW